MRRKKSLLIPAVLAFSLCTGAVVPVLAEETSQTADAADNEQEAHTQSATDTSDSPYEKGTITDTDFQSEWLNLKFTPPETVVMNTEEELQSVMKQGQTTLEEASGVELGEDALSGTVYEMMASSISRFPFLPHLLPLPYRSLLLPLSDQILSRFSSHSHDKNC